jgi:hypothetical protein
LGVFGKNGDDFDGQIVALGQVGGHEEGHPVLLGDWDSAS